MTDKTAVDARVRPTRAIEGFRSFALTPSGSAHLDLIRGLAAWAVMWGHLRGLFFVDFPHIQRRGVWLGAIYFLYGLLRTSLRAGDEPALQAALRDAFGAPPRP